MLHPITFSIPAEKICSRLEEKTKMISSLIPGKLSTYIYNDEESYYNEYKKSMFAMTTKKAGWDCMRHYEIICNGCLPYFPNIEKCPENTMTLLPKDLFIESNELFKKLKDKAPTELNSDEIKEYTQLVNKMLRFTRLNLTTKSLASYILDKSNHAQATKILYLSGSLYPDYLRCLCLHGFKELLGSNCHDFPKVPHIYKNHNIPSNRLYGKGFSYSGLLETDLHDDEWDKTLIDNIKERQYDLVVYGSFHRGMPFYDLVSSVYEPNKIILLCGEDIHACNYNLLIERGHTVFVREL